jgi:hypothetical protein
MQQSTIGHGHVISQNASSKNNVEATLVKRFRQPLLLAGLIAVMSVPAYGFEKPEDAIRALEDAYLRRDANGAVAARDFAEEARRMLLRLDAKLASEADILKQTAEVLELGYRKELKDSIFRLTYALTP